MKQNILVPAIISGALCFTIGFGGGALLTRPSREKTKAAIATVEAKAEKARTIAQQEIRAAKAETMRFQNELKRVTAKLEQAKDKIAPETAKSKHVKNTRRQNELKRSTTKREKQKRALEVKKEKPTQKSIHEAILHRELEGFFMDIPEVAWCKFDGNTVYVGFKTYPADGEAILRGAALHGNAAINFGCHVWAVHADQINNPPYYGMLSGKWYDEVTARYGRFE